MCISHIIKFRIFSAVANKMLTDSTDEVNAAAVVRGVLKELMSLQWTVDQATMLIIKALQKDTVLKLAPKAVAEFALNRLIRLALVEMRLALLTQNFQLSVYRNHLANIDGERGKLVANSVEQYLQNSAKKPYIEPSTVLVTGEVCDAAAVSQQLQVEAIEAAKFIPVEKAVELSRERQAAWKRFTQSSILTKRAIENAEAWFGSMMIRDSPGVNPDFAPYHRSALVLYVGKSVASALAALYVEMFQIGTLLEYVFFYRTASGDWALKTDTGTWDAYTSLFQINWLAHFPVRDVVDPTMLLEINVHPEIFNLEIGQPKMVLLMQPPLPISKTGRRASDFQDENGNEIGNSPENPIPCRAMMGYTLVVNEPDSNKPVPVALQAVKGRKPFDVPDGTRIVYFRGFDDLSGKKRDFMAVFPTGRDALYSNSRVEHTVTNTKPQVRLLGAAVMVDLDDRNWEEVRTVN